MKKKLFTILATAAALSAYADPVPIASAADWATFANRVNNGETALDAAMTADVTLTQDSPRVGTGDNKYSGTFNGAGHTLTLNWNLPEVKHVAPFAFVSGATISALHTTGSITTSLEQACDTGLIGWVDPPGVTVERCRSSVTITSTLVNGDASIAGFIADGPWVYMKVTITDCLFDGSLLAENAFYVGGFIVYMSDAPYVKITGSLFAPKAVKLSTEDGSSTFARGVLDSMTSSYYTTKVGAAQGTDATSMSAESLVTALGENWTVVDNKPMLKVFASSGSETTDPDPGTDPGTDPDPSTDSAAGYTFTFVSGGETLGTVAGNNPPVALKNGNNRFLGYFTEATGGTKIYNERYQVVEGALSSVSSGATLYAQWGAIDTGFAGIVYRGQLTKLTGDLAKSDDGKTYTKKMHFRVYDGEETSNALWSSGAKDVTVNADGSFVYSFGDETLAGLIATGNVTHVGVALGANADTAVVLKPRRALRPVAAVNRALTAEGAAPDIRIGNLISDNAIVAANATISHLEVSGTVTAAAESLKVAPVDIGTGESTKILRGGGVSVFADENPTVLKSNSGSVVKGSLLYSNVPYDGIVLISSCASGTRDFACPAVVLFCRAGENIYAPTTDLNGLKVTLFPFIAKEGR